ncbi:MAG: RNase H-like domain-containing protein [Bacteroidota bacterium]
MKGIYLKNMDEQNNGENLRQYSSGNSEYSTVELSLTGDKKEQLLNETSKYSKILENENEKLRNELKMTMDRYERDIDYLLRKDNDNKINESTTTKKEELLLETIALALKSITDNTRETKVFEGIRSINPTQNTFGGSSAENVDTWLNTINLNLEAANIPEDKKIIHAAGYLRDAAQQFYEAIKKENPSILWDNFQSQLRNRFRAHNFQKNLFIKLSDIKQKGSLGKHLENFTILINQTEGIPEHIKTSLFIKSLIPEISKAVSYRQPNKLSEAIQFARDYEEAYIKSEDNSQAEINFIRNMGFKQKIQCFHCNKSGHKKSECYLLNKKPQSAVQVSTRYAMNIPVKTKICSFCNKIGHLVEECFKKQRLEFNNGYNEPSNRNRDYHSRKESFVTPRDVEINNVNNMPQQNIRNDYTQNERPKPNLSKMKSSHVKAISTALYEEPKDLLQAYGTINGHKELMVFDTGAVVSVISDKLVKKYNIPVANKLKRVILADGRTEDANTTEEVTVTVHGTTCEVKMVILQNDDKPVLLGLDWMEDAKAIVDVANKSITFGAKSIYFTTIEDIDLSLVSDNKTNQCSVTEIEEKDIEDCDGWDEKIDKIEFITPCLNESENFELNKIVEKNRKAFAYEIEDLDKACNVKNFEIITTAETPIYQHPYRKSEKEREIINKEIEKMLKANIIRESNSPWSAPCIIVPKNDGSKRLCIDYRKLNKITVKNVFPLPRIDDIFDRLSNSSVYSTLDLKSGYWQIAVSENSIAKTAFSTGDGHYEFLRVPFGLRNAPSEFSQIMKMIFGNCSFIEVYIDDITIHSSSVKEHFEHIKFVFVQLIRNNLKLNITKCKWFQKEIKLLGHIITGKEIKMDPGKIESIRKWVSPSKLNHVQQFLGICGYYRRFIKDFSKIAAPLYGMLKKDKKWEWSKECEDAFQDLKVKLMTYPILRKPDFKKEFIIHTDASGLAVGAVLAQKDEYGEYACHYASRLLKANEIHYGITEKECLAVIWAVKFFRVYIFGSNFKIVTDHSALQWLISMKDPAGRLARWAIYLQAYDFEIIHRSGRKHNNADALSRPIMNIDIVESEDSDDETNISSSNLDPYEDNILLHYLKNGQFEPGTAENQRKRVLKLSTKYKLDGEKLLYTKNNLEKDFKEIPKAEKRIFIVKQNHELGHFASLETYKRISEKFYWKNMINDIKFVVGQCIPCCRYSKIRKNEHPALSLEVEGIFDRIGMDLIFGLPKTTEGFCGILVIIEYLTKYPYAVPIKSKESKEIARNLFQYISMFGPPKEILSDQGKEFVNSIVAELTKISGIQHSITSAYNPRCNGQTERFNATLMECLRKHTDSDKENWHNWIPFVLMAYRTKTNVTTKFTPFELMFGRKMRNFQDWTKNEDQVDLIALENRSLEIKEQYEDFLSKAKINIKNAKENQRNNQDKNHKIVERLKQGTKVYLQTPELLCKNKLEQKYIGPYTVHSVSNKGNYWLLNEDKELLKNSYPITKLKIVEANNQEEYVMEEIVGKRERNGKREYRVKWRNYPESCNSWIQEEKFTDITLIERFLLKETPTENNTEFENIQNEITNEVNRAKNKFKQNTGNLFNEKNTTSLVVWVKQSLNELSESAQEFDKKFQHIDELKNLEELEDIVLIKDNNRYIIYVIEREEFFNQPSIQRIEESLRKLMTKCTELGIRKIAFSKRNVELRDIPTEEIPNVLNRILDNHTTKVTIYPYEEYTVQNLTRRITRNSNRVNLIFTILLVFMKVIMCLGDELVVGQFKYCSTTMSSPITISEGNCSIIQDKGYTKYNVPHTVLEKMTYNVFGDAFVCKKTKFVTKTVYHWYFAQYQSSYEEVEILNRGECIDMVISKKCEKQVMTCTGSSCSLKFMPKTFYKYAKELEFIGYQCEVNKITIYSNDVNEKLYTNAVSSCMPKDLWCRLDEMTIAWEKSIIHECPFYEVTKLNLNVTNNILTSDDQNLLFQIGRKLNQCNVSMYHTTEGFYVVPGNVTLGLKKVEKELKTTQNLILSDIDYKTTLNLRKINKLKNNLSSQQCKNLKMFMRIFEKQHNKFFTLHDTEEIILFNNDGLILEADCIDVSNITIVSKMKYCFEQPEVFFEREGKRFFASLFEDKILAQNKEVRLDCRKRKITRLNVGEKIIITINGSNEILTTDNKIKDLSQMSSEDNNNIVIRHSNEFEKPFDPISQIEKQSKWRELNGHHYFVPDLHSKSTESEELGVGMEKLKNVYEYTMKIIPMLITIPIIFLIIFLAWLLKGCFRRCMCSKLSEKEETKEEDCEMQVIKIETEPSPEKREVMKVQQKQIKHVEESNSDDEELQRIRTKILLMQRGV